MTKLGLSSYAVSWGVGIPGYPQPAQPIDQFEVVRFADELGLQLVQLVDNVALHRLSPDERARLRADAAGRGIAIEVGTRGIEDDNINRYVEIAAYFGSPILRIVIDTYTRHLTPDEVIAVVRDALPALHRHAITLAIENHDRFKVRTLANIIETIDDPHVRICMDTVNSFGALEGPDIVVSTLGPYVVNLHLKPFTVRRVGHALGFEVVGTPANEGMLDVAWLLASLNSFGRDYNAILELWTPPETDIEATIHKEFDWVRQSVAYLRTLIPE